MQPIIFLLLFVYVFGGAIAGGGGDARTCSTCCPACSARASPWPASPSAQNLNADIEKGVFDRFRSLPIARSAPLVGAVLADFVRYLIVCAMLVGFGYVIGFRMETDPLALLAGIGIALVFALCFCWISVWVGMVVRSSGAVQGIMFLLVLPLSFGSNTFVPIDTMPGWMQAFIKVNPITHLVDAVRGLMVGGPVASHLLWTPGWWSACSRCSSRSRCAPTSARSDQMSGPRPGRAASGQRPGRGLCRRRRGRRRRVPSCSRRVAIWRMMSTAVGSSDPRNRAHAPRMRAADSWFSLTFRRGRRSRRRPRP